MKDVYYDAYTEIYEILSYMPINYIRKLPKELLNLFEQKRNKEYKYCVNTEKKINEQDMLIETKSILAVLYRDFWSTKEKKEIILEKERTERDLYQNELRQKYNYNNIFKDESQLKYNSKAFSNNVAMIEYKESIFKRIMNKIKNIFNLH